MAEIGGAVIGGAAGITAAAYTHTSNFSARHDQCHDLQSLETQRLSQGFEKAYREGNIADEDYAKFLEMKDVAIISAREYRRSIREYKDTSPLKIAAKQSKKREVRKKKEQIRAANHDLLDHLYDSASGESDATSMTATNGSPPGSGLESENIWEWAHGITDRPTTNHDSWHSRIRQARNDLESIHSEAAHSFKLVANGANGQIPLIQCEIQAIKFAREAEEYDEESDITLAIEAYSKSLSWLDKCKEASGEDANGRTYLERIENVALVYKERISALREAHGPNLIVLE
ncbi:hypothetical protein NLJ89_g4085 [Agrocybe chaxingu]|uniref:Uncharacterized protein n=1 Tax=Agrocybe chaxingu TaxID=84603 RepID=A0A9W8MY70_9AGAR|nr:hypothetical protein NLJ89_g4085 [Agrocybe chaxingu]